MSEEVTLDELIGTLTARLRDAMRDLEAATRCLERFRAAHPEQVSTCILEYLKEGEVKPG